MNQKKAPFCLGFSRRLPQICREMAQLQENINGITAVFYTCARSDGNCSPLSREKLKQLTEQFTDVMEVRIQPHSWRLLCVCLLAAGLAGWVKLCTPMRVYRTPGSLGKAQMPSKPRICREEERLSILPAPAACGAQCREQDKAWGSGGIGVDFCPETAPVLLERWHKWFTGFANTICLFTEPSRTPKPSRRYYASWMITATAGLTSVSCSAWCSK